MSWFARIKEDKPPLSEADLREAKRKKLESDRLQRLKQRENRQKQFEAVARAQQEANEALEEILNLDPNIFEGDVEDISVSESEIEELLNETKMNFDQKNEDNGADAIKSLGQIKVNWDAENPQYFFQKLETELQIFSINKQFTKRQALIRCLPDDVAKEFMHLVTLQETEAGNLPYKTLKDALIKAYGPRPGDAFQRAMNRVMISKPSVLLKLLISDICRQNLTNCCCSTTVWGLFELKIPMYLKMGLADQTLNNTTMHAIMDRADNLWAANQSKEISIVTKPAESEKKEEKEKETSDAEVAAVGNNRGRGSFRPFRGRGRGNRGYRGGGRGGQNQPQNQPDPRGQRHASNPPWNSCTAHWLHAEGAWKCQAPTTCPMKDKVTPKK